MNTTFVNAFTDELEKLAYEPPLKYKKIPVEGSIPAATALYGGYLGARYYHPNPNDKLMKRIAKRIGRTAKGSVLGYLLGMPPGMVAALAYRGATGKPLLVDTRRRSKK